MTDNLSKSLKSTEYELSWANRGLKANNADDVKELCEEIEQCKHLVALRLEGNTINEEAATAIGMALEAHSEIERLIWNDLFTTRLKTEVPPSLIKLTQGLITNGCHIVEINLSDNAFGPIGVKGLETFLSSTACYTLEELRLNNCGMGIGGGKLLAEALIACHKNSGGKFALKQFVAGRNRLENEGAQALAKAFEIIGTLEVVRVPQNGIRPPGIEALANAFVQNQNLRIIDLNDNTITLATPKLASSIEKLPNLEIINLESSLIRTPGTMAIARSIMSHKNLQELYLGCNDMHTEGGMEIAHVVKNMSSLRILDLNGNCFGQDGIDEIRRTLENKSFANQMVFSDDEGSEDDEEEEGEEGDENYEDEEYDEEEENDEDYEDEEGEEEEDVESPSFFFGKNPIQQNAWNNFQLGTNKTTPPAQPESINDLSSMIANFNVCTPFSFGSQLTTEATGNKWTTFTNLDKVKEHLKNDDQSVDRAVKLLEDMWNDNSVLQNDTSSIASNTLKALTFTSDSERTFNERLLVSLGFVKDEQTGRQRRAINQRDKAFRTLVDVNKFLPKSTKNLLSVFLQNTPVTKSNQHLEVNLFDDENKQSLGQMPLIEAQKLAKFRELILVLFDESHDPPDVRLMTGKQLAQIRDNTRANKKQDLANDKITDFVVRLRSNIAEKDLLTKLGQAKAAYSKGSSIRFSLDFGYAIDEKETEKLAQRTSDQKEFLARLKPYLEEFPKVHTNSKGTRSIILIVPSKLLTDKPNKKQESGSPTEEIQEPASKDVNNKSPTNSSYKRKKSI
ncbi:unnamed protein product [Adineta steineri]|uniref:Translation initiation factor 3 N-terminal domain-containing protein n=1 Tax=Adineta steineri TaxID=433720 RepID=A0A819C0H5_9BILA|nr:unnamed protein product [Adineta steineri]CAF3804936.1 unnamed protein product [Adineta steineri]